MSTTYVAEGFCIGHDLVDYFHPSCVCGCGGPWYEFLGYCLVVWTDLMEFEYWWILTIFISFKGMRGSKGLIMAIFPRIFAGEMNIFTFEHTSIQQFSSLLRWGWGGQMCDFFLWECLSYFFSDMKRFAGIFEFLQEFLTILIPLSLGMSGPIDDILVSIFIVFWEK